MKMKTPAGAPHSHMQEKKYSITGQSETSSGAMVRSQAVICDFVLAASGWNLQVLEDAPPSDPGYGIWIRGFYKGSRIAGHTGVISFPSQLLYRKLKRTEEFPLQRWKPYEIREAQRSGRRRRTPHTQTPELRRPCEAAGDIAKSRELKSLNQRMWWEAKKLSRTL